jgi:hypothetical protein
MYAADVYKLRLATQADARLLRRLLALDERTARDANPSLGECLLAALTA